jgi:HSP20 family protein
MAETATKLPIKTAEKRADDRPAELQSWRPFESLRREVDRLFEDFDHDFWHSRARRSVFDIEPFWRRELTWGAAPAVDIVEKDAGFEITADLPGFDEKNVEVAFAEGGLTIKGDKREEREEKKKGYFLQERRAGSFERHFRVPEGVDADKIEASFKKGVLTVTLPKKPEAQKPAKKIEIKAT